MRVDPTGSTTCCISGMDSPPNSAIWSTERRLLEKPVPGAPRKSDSRVRRFSSAITGNDVASAKKLRTLLPSSTIDEDDDDTPCVVLNFRPTRFFFEDEQSDVIATQQDPTTVLLLPQVPSPWLYDAEDDSGDTVLSPRLFRFGSACLSRFEVVEFADDESNSIFRHQDEPETRESFVENTQRIFSRAPNRDDNRV